MSSASSPKAMPLWASPSSTPAFALAAAVALWLLPSPYGALTAAVPMLLAAVGALDYVVRRMVGTS